MKSTLSIGRDVGFEVVMDVSLENPSKCPMVMTV